VSSSFATFDSGTALYFISATVSNSVRENP
jgi:hypothetical protein